MKNSTIALLILLFLALCVLHGTIQGSDDAKLSADAQRALDKADADIAKVRHTLVVALTAAQDSATRKGNLDQALAIKQEIEKQEKLVPGGVAKELLVEAHSSRDVIFYAQANFQGQATIVRTFGTVTDAYVIGFPNDGLRSIKVPKGITVTVYEGNLGGGAAQEITQDMAELSGVAALGMSSFKLTR